MAVVRMAHGKVNALDTTLCGELAAQLTELERSGHRAAVLTGQGPIFSAVPTCCACATAAPVTSRSSCLP